MVYIIKLYAIRSPALDLGEQTLASLGTCVVESPVLVPWQAEGLENTS